MNVTLVMKEICLLVNVLICFGIPIIGTMVMTKKGCAPMRPFLLGMVAFLLSQALLMPVSLIFGNSDFLNQNMWLNGCLYAIISAVIVEGMRFFFLKINAKKQKDIWDGVAFGFGQGGLEAVLLVGIADEAILVALLKGVGTATKESAGMILLGGVQQIFAMAFHVGAALILWYGIQKLMQRKMIIIVMILHVILNIATSVLAQAIHIDTIFIVLFTGVYAFFVLAWALKQVKKSL